MHVRQRLGASERHACHVLGQPRSTQRRVKKLPGDEEALRTDEVPPVAVPLPMLDPEPSVVPGVGAS